jgi:hypothetical protein
MFRAGTPKALNNTAQGKRRSRATLGDGAMMSAEPQRGSTRLFRLIGPLCNLSGLAGIRAGVTQGALRDPGLCCVTASRLSLFPESSDERFRHANVTRQQLLHQTAFLLFERIEFPFEEAVFSIGIVDVSALRNKFS